jgi:hypothetical protein
MVVLSHVNTQHRLRYGLCLAAWLTTVAFGFSMSAGKLSDNLRIKSHQGLEQETNVRAYLCSGEITHLKNKPLLFVPYPNPERLKTILDNPTIRSILPGNVYRPNSHHPVSTDGEPFCDPGALARAFNVLKWENFDEKVVFAKVASIISNSWQGTDYFKSTIPEFRIFGSYINSEKNTGMITLHMHRNEKLLYRSGPRVNGQFVLINNGELGQYNTELPIAIAWSILDFNNPKLPNEFDITLIDAGTKWGEWSTIAVKIN